MLCHLDTIYCGQYIKFLITAKNKTKKKREAFAPDIHDEIMAYRIQQAVASNPEIRSVTDIDEDAVR